MYVCLYLEVRDLNFEFFIHGKNIFRYDKSLVELVNWYVAIFGEDIWRILAFEVSFWSHSKNVANDRETHREVIILNFH